MTMHIEGPWLSTLRTQSKKTKITKAQQEEIERGWRERNARLKQMGLPKETLEEYTNWLYGRGPKTKAHTKVKEGQKNASSSSKHIQLPDVHAPRSLGSWVTGAVASKQTPTYTGTKMIGIGVMHKSNSVPIFSDEEAIDIAKMRRG